MMTAGTCFKKEIQVASWNNDGTTQINGCKCSFEKHYALIDISIKFIVYMQFLVASTPWGNNVSIEKWLGGTTFVKKRYGEPN